MERAGRMRLRSEDMLEETQTQVLLLFCFLKCASSNFETILMSNCTLNISMASPLCADVEAEIGLFPLLAHFCISPRVVTWTMKRWIWELRERLSNATSAKRDL